MQIAARVAIEIAMTGVIGRILLIEMNRVPLPIERFQYGAVRSCVAITPRGGNGEPKNGDLQRLLQQETGN
jgi:hypothetical protein